MKATITHNATMTAILKALRQVEQEQAEADYPHKGSNAEVDAYFKQKWERVDRKAAPLRARAARALKQYLDKLPVSVVRSVMEGVAEESAEQEAGHTNAETVPLRQYPTGRVPIPTGRVNFQKMEE